MFFSYFRFAVNLQLFLSRPKAKFAYRVKRGHQVRSMLMTLGLGNPGNSD